METADQPEKPEKFANDFIAYICVLGDEGTIWCHLVLDVQELTWPEFCHQN